MSDLKRGDVIEYKSVQYTIAYFSLNYVFIKDKDGNQYKLSYDKVKKSTDETTHT